MYVERSCPYFGARLWMMRVACTALFSALLWRLWEVQVRQGQDHARTIARQSIRRIRLGPVRGRITAAGGERLVDNKPSFSVVFHMAEMRQPGSYAATVNHILSQTLKLARIIGRPMPFGRKRVDRHLRVYPALPLTVFDRLTPVELARACELFPPIPGMEVSAGIVRHYPYPGVATHLLGIAGKERPDFAGTFGRYKYVRPEFRGRGGLEKQYEDELSGTAGTELVRVGTLGYVHETISTPRAPQDGNDLILTIDVRAQTAAEEALAGARGALVALNTRNGAVLAMASAPTYDLASLDGPTYAALRTRISDRPLANRAMAAGYLPGSIVKPLMGLAALASGAIVADDVVVCEGAYRIGDRPIRCWRRSGHGPVDLLSAIEQSCNTYFIDAGQRVGLDRISPLLAAAGLGEDPGLDLPHLSARTSGFLPTRWSAPQRLGRAWLAIDTAFLSIGQGAIALSPLQAAMFTAALANGGTVYRPYLVQRVLSPTGVVIRNAAPQVLHRLPTTPEHLGLVREGMWRVVNGEDASAELARNDAITLAGKTGTAEVGSGETRTKNAWFICFGPWEAPEIAVAVVIENGVSGGRTAAPVARRFLTAWLGADTGSTGRIAAPH